MRYRIRARVIQAIILLWTRWLYRDLDLLVRRYKKQQMDLERRYDLADHEPRPYDETTRQHILAVAAGCPQRGHFAWTSGTTNEPKQLFYPKSRIRRIQRLYLEQVLLAYEYVDLKRPAFYLLTSMVPDKSFSSLVGQKRLQNPLARLVLSESITFVPAVARLTNKYSQSSLHLALMKLSAPTLIVMANPSSLSVLLARAHSNWVQISEELAGILREEVLAELRKQLGPALEPREASLRALIARSKAPSSIDLLPELKAVFCWDGGYVQPFIDNLRSQLSDLKPRFMPMFSMSTETVAYLVYPRLPSSGGLPIYPDVCYEFIDVDDILEAQNIIKPWRLKAGNQYVMVVSDQYGLKRYYTEDIFECLGFRQQTPKLRFLRRIGLTYSFTGEKITDRQLLAVYELLRDNRGKDNVLFTCFPKLNRGSVPGYVLVCLPEHDAVVTSGQLAERFDQLLMKMNVEYATKRNSGRLSPPELAMDKYEDLVRRITLSSPRYQGASRAQFKFLPLYRILWEDLYKSREGGPDEDVANEL